MDISAVILAAGKGVRMRSSLPKVAHRVAGRAMIAHLIKTVRAAGIEQIIVVVGHGREYVEEILAGENVAFVVQEEQLGTGHALMQAQDAVRGKSLLVLAGDTPLLRPQTLAGLMEMHEKSQARATVLTTRVKDPKGYGRVLRGTQGEFARIVEEKDASPSEKAIDEINSGIYCFDRELVFKALSGIGTQNAQGEYYLTEALELIKADNNKVEICLSDVEEEIYGVNDRIQLAQVEGIMRQRINRELMAQGVAIIDPASTFIDAEVKIAPDTVILPFTIIEGRCSIGSFCEIGPSTRISNSVIGDRVTVESSRINQACIGNACTIGPFAYLRPETVLHDNVKVGDFVEIKKSVIDDGSKVPHLSYVGDAQIGKGVNVGAGTITCNYDGVNKYPTILEDGVFIGSNTNLIAPIRVGKNASTGAGSSVSRDIPEDVLAVERAATKFLTKRTSKKKHVDS
ncbi:MAG: bifunctional UDP-N-acetylglucosamine diphosphorylase/glucosamine-1-phosphate N-acetyltransferase GlmU [Syntrophomonas sp.]